MTSGYCVVYDVPRGILVETGAVPDSMGIARALAAVIQKDGAPDLT